MNALHLLLHNIEGSAGLNFGLIGVQKLGEISKLWGLRFPAVRGEKLRVTKWRNLKWM